MSKAPKSTPGKGKKRATAANSHVEPIPILLAPSPSAASVSSEDVVSVPPQKKKRFFWKLCVERLVDWITGPEGSGENYKRWKSTSTSADASSTRKISGDSKKQIASEIAAELVTAGFADATGKAVQNKIELLEASYKNALTCLRETGFGIDDDDIKKNITTLEQKVLVLCPYYKRLDPVFGERPAFNPPALGGSTDNPIDLARCLTSDETVNLGDDSSDDAFASRSAVHVPSGFASSSAAGITLEFGTQSRLLDADSVKGCTVLCKPEFLKRYRTLMEDEMFYEESNAVTWEVKIVDSEVHGITERGAGYIHFAIGMSRLFLKQKMERFAGLLDRYEKDDTAVSVVEVVERWESMTAQIGAVHAEFEKLEALSANGWNKPEKRAPPPTPQIPNTSITLATKPALATALAKPAPSQQRKAGHHETRSKGSNASASIDSLTEARKEYWDDKLKLQVRKQQQAQTKSDQDHELQAQKQKQAEKKADQDHEYRMQELDVRRTVAAASEKDAEARKEEALTSRMMVDFIRAQLPLPR